MLLAIGAREAGVTGIALEGGFPFRLTRERASVRFQNVRFSVRQLGWQRDVVLANIYGDRSAQRWSIANAIQQANDELLLAILDVQGSNSQSVPLPQYLSEFKKKHVLVLGDYSDEGEARLQAIAAALRELGYVPVLVKDIPEEPHYDLQQKVVTVGSTMRFVVVDDSSKSGHILEIGRIQDNRWIAIILRLADSHGTFMTRGLSETSRGIVEESYTPDTLKEVLQRSTEWAEGRIAELKQGYENIYPWRQAGN